MAIPFDNTNRIGSIVNNSELYQFLPCRKHGRPDFIAFIDSTNAGTISLANGIISITGCLSGRSPLKIPYSQIRGLAESITGSAAVAGVRRVFCYTGDCADFKGLSLTVRRELANCNVEEKTWHYYKAYESCTETAITCAAKLADFAAHINADPTAPFVALYVDAGTDYIQLTDKVAGDTLNFLSIEGFENLTVSTPPTVGGLDAQSLKDSWGITCIDGAVAGTKLYQAVIFQFMQETPLDSDFYGSSNPVSDPFSYKGKLKTVAVVSDASNAPADAVNDELVSILGYAKGAAYYHSHIAGVPAPSVPSAPTPTPTP